MPPFHAYAIEEDLTAYATGVFYQGFTITFSSRDVADEWWRAVVEDKREKGDPVKDLINKKLPSAFTTLHRITPQHYTYTGATVRDTVFGTDTVKRDLLGYEGKVFMTRLPWDRLFVIPEANFRDHVNNETFFIRCKREPTIYWYVDGRGRIRASHRERAKFQILIQGNNTADDTTIMIGTDTVGLTAVSSIADSSTTCSDLGPVGANANGELVISSTALTFPFSAFKSGFEIQSVATLEDSASSTAIVQVRDGEEWELV